MKQKYTVVINQIFQHDCGTINGTMPVVVRVNADRPSDVCKYFNNEVTHIFMGHPPLQGENGREKFLEVIDIP